MVEEKKTPISVQRQEVRANHLKSESQDLVTKFQLKNQKRKEEKAEELKIKLTEDASLTHTPSKTPKAERTPLSKNESKNSKVGLSLANQSKARQSNAKLVRSSQ